MNKYEIGTIVKFSNGKSYGVSLDTEFEGKKYVCLATTTEPLEILFAEVTGDKLRVIREREEKERVFLMFAK